jgi:uncharacterized protein (TIGR02996 family)
VLVEFLRRLSVTIHELDPVVLILRGSLLLRHWFGERARPAADIDLECFEKREVRNNVERQRFMSLVDNGRGLCCFAADPGEDFPPTTQGIAFDEIDAPEDGESLWTYGSPGERFYLGWKWRDQRGLTGRLQIDIAEAGSYGLDDFSVADVQLVSGFAGTFRFPAYTPEMMLAAKLSWLIRSVTRRVNDGAPVWTGEPKDLFDTLLLLTKADLRADVFQKALLAVGTDDELNWNDLENLFDVRLGKMTDRDFPNWEEFRERHQSLITCGPVQMLRTVVDRLEPLLGFFYLPEEMPFLLVINADPMDEFSYSIYTDWLEGRANPRANFLRLFTRFFFREDELSPEERVRTRTALQAALHEMSVPWLHQLFGTSSRFREIKQRIENRSL